MDRARFFRCKKYGFLLPLLVPALPAASFGLARLGLPADLAAWHTLFVVFVLIPLADKAVGPDRVNPTDEEALALARDPFYRTVLLACVPLQLASVAFGAWAFAHRDPLWELGFWGALGWIASVGTITGALAINVAHELIHRAGRLEQWAGGTLLCTAAYPGFKIEHVRGHHVDIATPADNTTARRGQTVYAYLLLAFAINFRKAWRFEAQRLAALGLPALHPRNELAWWYALTALFAAATFAALGAAGLAFFAAQAVFGIALLEVVNYIEHYGLERRRLPDGRYEPVSARHSWNANWLVTNLFLFQLQRHADHHRYARRPYQLLRDVPAAPQLPAGYAAMIPVALVPPLWFRVMDPRVEAAARPPG